jgi:hypothetical protein
MPPAKKADDIARNEYLLALFSRAQNRRSNPGLPFLKTSPSVEGMDMVHAEQPQLRVPRTQPAMRQLAQLHG